MAHFAKINENNIVVNIQKVPDEEEHRGEVYLNAIGFEGRWIQTSYNSNFRKRYGGVGTTYLEDLDMFVPPKPSSSWVLNTNTGDWEPPIPFPEEHGKWRPETKDYIHYDWNETEQKWENPTSTLGM